MISGFLIVLYFICHTWIQFGGVTDIANALVRTYISNLVLKKACEEGILYGSDCIYRVHAMVGIPPSIFCFVCLPLSWLFGLLLERLVDVVVLNSRKNGTRAGRHVWVRSSRPNSAPQYAGIVKEMSGRREECQESANSMTAVDIFSSRRSCYQRRPTRIYRYIEIDWPKQPLRPSTATRHVARLWFRLIDPPSSSWITTLLLIPSSASLVFLWPGFLFGFRSGKVCGWSSLLLFLDLFQDPREREHTLHLF